MANKDSISKERTAELMAEYGKNPQDSGSAEVQVAILTERIRNLTGDWFLFLISLVLFVFYPLKTFSGLLL